MFRMTADKIVEFVEKIGFSRKCIVLSSENDCHSCFLDYSENNNKMHLSMEKIRHLLQ